MAKGFNWGAARGNRQGYEEAFPRRAPSIGTLDGCRRPATDALAAVVKMGNERAGIKTDCLHCWTHLRKRVALESRTSRKIFVCTDCGSRWRRGDGNQIVRLAPLAQEKKP